jgi:hypothetical protein
MDDDIEILMNVMREEPENRGNLEGHCFKLARGHPQLGGHAINTPDNYGKYWLVPRNEREVVC